MSKWVEEVDHRVGDLILVKKTDNYEYIYDIVISDAENQRPIYVTSEYKRLWSNEFINQTRQLKKDKSKALERVNNIGKPLKYNSGKPIMSLVRPEFTLALADCLTYGAEKYNEERGDTPNYLKSEGFNYSTIYDSLQRHLSSFWSGEDIDPESQKNHLILAAANLMFLYTYSISKEKGKDDRIVINKK